MEFKAKVVGVMPSDSDMQIVIKTPFDFAVHDKLLTFADFGKEITVEFTEKKKKRSLDSNAYMWVLCQKIAEALKTSKDEIYLQMLEQYGQFEIRNIEPCAIKLLEEKWRAIRILGWVTEKGRDFLQVMCFYGSHTYDQKEMSVLIDGVVSEAKELGIETLPPDELARMKERWCGA